MRQPEKETRAAHNADNWDGWQLFVEGCSRAWFMRSPNLILDAVGQAIRQQRVEMRDEFTLPSRRSRRSLRPWSSASFIALIRTSFST